MLPGDVIVIFYLGLELAVKAAAVKIYVQSIYPLLHII